MAVGLDVKQIVNGSRRFRSVYAAKLDDFPVE